jgi:hypothetical protein
MGVTIVPPQDMLKIEPFPRFMVLPLMLKDMKIDIEDLQP